MSYMLELKHKGLSFILQEGLKVAFDINNPNVRAAMLTKGDLRIIEVLKEVLILQSWINETLDEQKNTIDFDKALNAVKRRWSEK